jgi:GNAT superfamily N-acetyltransferase
MLGNLAMAMTGTLGRGTDTGPTCEDHRVPEVLIRPRTPDDVAPLTEVLWEQQPSSRYPLRNPLPIPVEQFLHVGDAVAAWVAEVDGRAVGNVCRTRPPSGDAVSEEENEACARAHGCTVDDLAYVSTLFVGLDTRGLGLGRRLLDTVVADIRRTGHKPCLEVLAVHPAAQALYVASGWREVLQTRPAWMDGVPDDVPDVRVMVLPDRRLRA